MLRERVAFPPSHLHRRLPTVAFAVAWNTGLGGEEVVVGVSWDPYWLVCRSCRQDEDSNMSATGSKGGVLDGKVGSGLNHKCFQSRVLNAKLMMVMTVVGKAEGDKEKQMRIPT